MDWPGLTCSTKLGPTPSTAGISNARARIAAWLVRPPDSVTIPLIMLRDMPTMSDGRRSFATRITSVSKSASEILSFLRRWPRIRLITSWTSDTRSWMRGSGEEESLSTISVSNERMADSTLKRFSFNERSIWSSTSGSSSIMRCASKMLACSSPASSLARSRNASISRFASKEAS